LAIQLGAFALGRRNVLDLASGPMRELSESVRMTVVLSIWGPSGPVVAKVHENRSRAVLITVPVGTQLSLDTAQSVLYMAHSDDPLATRRLLVSLPAAAERDIVARIEAATAAGIAMKSFDDGITSIAAPVFGASGISATIALVHTSAMLPMNPDSVEVARLREVARELSLELGGNVAQ
jgi:DNA-binding IclR family transcriptional regulator